MQKARLGRGKVLARTELNGIKRREEKEQSVLWRKPHGKGTGLNSMCKREDVGMLGEF